MLISHILGVWSHLLCTYEQKSRLVRLWRLDFRLSATTTAPYSELNMWLTALNNDLGVKINFCQKLTKSFNANGFVPETNEF